MRTSRRTAALVRASFAVAAAIAVLLLAVSPTASVAADASSGGQGAVRVDRLVTEYAHNPLGIDVPRPRLSWQLESPVRGEQQTAYQILVSSSESDLMRSRGVVWDSGKVSSSQSINVQYGGEPLSSRTRYYWKVRVWDSRGGPSQWSAPAWWETALLQQSDWTATWIGAPSFDSQPDLAGADWIWYPEGDLAHGFPSGTRYFRLHFNVPSDRTIASATLTASADNQVTAYLNGNQVAASSDWTQGVRQDVAAALTPGANVLAFSAYNINGAAGLIARLRITFTDGDPLVVDTGGSATAANTAASGWQAPGFDDSTWLNAMDLGAYGIAPWKEQVKIPRPSPAAGPLLRKEFTPAGKQISRVRAYISGLGNYTLRINGRKVGDRVLDPAYTQYEKTVLYSTYDVTRDVHPGRNAIAVTLAPGFYYYATPKLIMQLVIDYADGTSATIATDDTWQVDTAGPTLFDTVGGASGQPVFGGETYDARRDPIGWDRPGFDASDWQAASTLPAPGGRLVASGAMEPVTVAANVEPVGFTQPKPGTYVVDMGRTLTGWIRLTAAGQPGDKVSIQYGEKLNADGTVFAKANPGPRPRWQRDEYIFGNSGVETWEPSFTFKSFRYVQLDGLSAPPQLSDVLGRLVHNAVPTTGQFSSSDTLYNQIHQTMQRTTLNVLLGYPSIDPANERNGWTADTQLITPSATDNFGMDAFLAQWLVDIQDGQRADGTISKIDPIRDGCCYGGSAPEWTAAYPLVAWDLYVRYGDLGVLESHYDSLAKYVQSELGSLNDGIAPASVYGDWYSPGYGPAPEDRRLTATAYVYREATLMADIATALGRASDATNYRSTADFIKTKFNQLFLDTASGQYRTASDPGYRQASNAIPLAFGMVPDEYRASVVQGLADDVVAHGGHLNTGILGTPALLDVLTSNGHADLAHTIANQTTYPSWGQWIQAGADTLWESWGLNARSHNHPMFGTVDAWFYQDVAGISPDPEHPGYQHSIIKPHPMTAPSSASATYDSMYGKIETAWTATAGSFAMDVRIPGNASSTVYVPVGTCSTVTESGRPADQAPGVESLGTSNGYAEFSVGSGSYHFRCGS